MVVRLLFGWCWCGSGVEQLIRNQQVEGPNPSTSFFFVYLTAELFRLFIFKYKSSRSCSTNERLWLLYLSYDYFEGTSISLPPM